MFLVLISLHHSLLSIILKIPMHAVETGCILYSKHKIVLPTQPESTLSSVVDRELYRSRFGDHYYVRIVGLLGAGNIDASQKNVHRSSFQSPSTLLPVYGCTIIMSISTNFYNNQNNSKKKKIPSSRFVSLPILVGIARPPLFSWTNNELRQFTPLFFDFFDIIATHLTSRCGSGVKRILAKSSAHS